MHEMTLTYAEAKKIFSSPALMVKAKEYPERFNNKVPLTVKMLKTVSSDMPPIALPGFKIVQAYNEFEYPVWVNSYGAVAVVFEDGETLGVKPDEFEVVKWH